MNAGLPRVLIPSDSMRLERRVEDQLVSFALERLDHHRQAMGRDGEGAFQRGSWLWRRHIATRMYEQDFSHRAAERALFEAANLSLNMVAQFIEQHKARMTRDLFNSDTFFGIVPEGPEDQNEVLKDVERWLHHRGKKSNLQQSFKTNGLLAALIRGEAVCKTTLKVTRRSETRRVRPMIVLGEVQRDSSGGIITDADVWERDPENPARQVLARDRLVSLPADMRPEYAPKPVEVPVSVNVTRGADVSFVHWADFVAPLDAVHLDSAELLAHCLQMAVPDLMDTLPAEEADTPQSRAYLAAARNSGVEGGEKAEQRQVREHRGEGDTAREAVTGMGYKERRFDEIYLRVDWRGTGRYDRVAMLIDRALRWPVYYAPVSEMLHWTDRPHPFRVARIHPCEDRWYGRGYYERFGAQAEFADACWCRMELELQRSGNILVENIDAHEGGRAGRPILFRSKETLQVSGGAATVEDVLKVITVTPQIVEVKSALDTTLQKLQSEAGVIGPGDYTTEALNGSDTLGEAQIAEANKSVSLEEREGELTPGFNDILRDFAGIELDVDGLDVEQLAKLLENTALADTTPLPQVVPVKNTPNPGAEPPTAASDPAVSAPAEMQPPPLTGKQRALRMLEWVKQHGDDLLEVIRIFVTRARQGQLFAQSQKVLEVLERWLLLPPEVRTAQRPVYANLLRALDEQNPDALLGPDAPPGLAPPPVMGAAPPRATSPAA